MLILQQPLIASQDVSDICVHVDYFSRVELREIMAFDNSILTNLSIYSPYNPFSKLKVVLFFYL